MTKAELIVELEKLHKASKYILEDWLEESDTWPVYLNFKKAVDGAERTIKKVKSDYKGRKKHDN